MSMVWEKEAQELFNKLIEKTPVFVREMAKEKISKKAEQLVSDEKRNEVVEKDVVDAFFIETPGGFHGPLKNDMDSLGIDYKAYGHEDVQMFWRTKKKQ
ncbi:MAG: PCP reductase family protein [Candidatus Omnitrophica bacterium]|nr:PCP reductase family protein [Candidatus Omnitrophota bacterium]MBU1997172.1 PCP reductase family protein [Candidatus Omnitrophota bacterium]